jgi:hypothetical protein
MAKPNRINRINLGQKKTLNSSTTRKGIQEKDVKRSYSDNFDFFGPWRNIKGAWQESNAQASTPTSASEYPISINYDIVDADITAQISTFGSGAGLAFWVVGPGDWWAAIPYYTQNSEQYISSYYNCNCRQMGCWGHYCHATHGCHDVCGETCDQCPNYSTGTRYRFYTRLIRSVSGTVSTIQDTEVRTTLNDSNDNFAGIRLITNGQNIKIFAIQDNSSYYGTVMDRNEPTANKGPNTGIIYAPGGTATSNVLDSYIASAN